MSFRFSWHCSASTLAALAIGWLSPGVSRAAEPPRGRPIEFSDTKSGEISTNLNQLNSKRGGLRDLEDDLYKPLLNFSLRSSLDGAPAPPVRTGPGPRPLTRREKERLEQRRNWVLSSPEEMLAGPTLEEIFHLPEYGPDGKEKSKKSAVEKYYERLERERLSQSELLLQDELLEGRKRSDSLDETKAKDDTTSSGGLTEQEKTLRRLFDAQPTSALIAPEPAKSSFSDVFGLGNATTSAELSESHKLTMKQLEQFLNSSSSPLTAAGVPNSLSGLSSARPAPLVGLESLAGAVPSGFGAVNSALGSSGPQDLSVKGFEPLSPSMTPPKVEMPKPPRPPSVMDFPQRKF